MSEISGFVREALYRGRSRTDIIVAMTAAGWPEKLARAEVDRWVTREGMPPLPTRQKPTFRPAVIGILILITVLIGNIVASAFWLVAEAIPDPTDPGISVLPRWSIASLAVLGPVAAVIARKNGEAYPQWALSMLTALPVAVLIGDAISVVYALLSGDMSARFVAKSTVVAGLAMIVMTAGRSGGDAIRRLCAVLLAISLPIAVICVVASGGPGQGRLERMDATRTSDVYALAREIACVAADGQDCRRGEARRTDPFTGAPYMIGHDGDAVTVCFVPQSRAVRDLLRGPGEPSAGCQREAGWETGKP